MTTDTYNPQPGESVMSRFSDDRTAEQRKTHTIGVGGTDRFLSMWRCNGGCASYAFWACRPEDAQALERYVRSRSDMMRVRTVCLDGYRPSGVHVHVYVYNPDHHTE